MAKALMFAGILLLGIAWTNGEKTRFSNMPTKCVLSPDAGNCYAFVPSFFFNITSGRCEMFIYGGCGGNANRFRTDRDCTSDCACFLLPETGPCRASMRRYFYIPQIQSCGPFTYGGCNGNANNFDSSDSCQSMCNSPAVIQPAQPPIAQLLPQAVIPGTFQFPATLTDSSQLPAALQPKNLFAGMTSQQLTDISNMLGSMALQGQAPPNQVPAMSPPGTPDMSMFGGMGPQSMQGMADPNQVTSMSSQGQSQGGAIDPQQQQGSSDMWPFFFGDWGFI